MSKKAQPTNKPLMQSLTVFFTLFAFIVGLTLFFDFTGIDLGGLLFLVAFLCCVFVAKNIYDISRAAENTSALKQVISKEAAFASEEMYIQLYRNSPVPYILVALDGTVESANISAVRTFGVTKTESKA